jgi:hypothetical protein
MDAWCLPPSRWSRMIFLAELAAVAGVVCSETWRQDLEL